MYAPDVSAEYLAHGEACLPGALRNQRNIEQDVSRDEAGSEPEATAAWRERVLKNYENDSREVQTLDATSFVQVSTAAKEVDVIVNCAVTRFDTTMCCTFFLIMSISVRCVGGIAFSLVDCVTLRLQGA